MTLSGHGGGSAAVRGHIPVELLSPALSLKVPARRRLRELSPSSIPRPFGMFRPSSNRTTTRRCALRPRERPGGRRRGEDHRRAAGARSAGAGIPREPAALTLTLCFRPLPYLAPVGEVVLRHHARRSQSAIRPTPSWVPVRRHSAGSGAWSFSRLRSRARRKAAIPSASERVR